MRNIGSNLTIVVLGLIASAVWNTFFTVQQTEQALVLRFGEPVRVVNTPGLTWKVPMIDTVIKIDKRVLEVDVPGPSRPQGEEVITADQQGNATQGSEQQKRIVVDAFARYKIVDPLRFFQTVGTIGGAESRLSPIIISVVRRVLGGVQFIEIVRDKRPALMVEITKQVDVEAKNFGIEVIDVRLRRADLPQAISNSVFESMKTQFLQQATDIRSQGLQKRQEIQAEADRKATVLRAEAQQKADEARGQGEGERNRIFAEAFNKDPEFFSFYRSMQAYEAGLKSGDTKMVISPNSDFFRYFNDPSGRAKAK